MVVVVNTFYPNDPLENRVIQHLSQAVQRHLNTSYYSEYYLHLAETQNERVNVMETLELDTLTDTVSIVRSNLAMHLLDTPFAIWQPIWRPHLLERVYKPIRTPHWCGVLPLRALEIGCK